MRGSSSNFEKFPLLDCFYPWQCGAPNIEGYQCQLRPVLLLIDNTNLKSINLKNLPSGEKYWLTQLLGSGSEGMLTLKVGMMPNKSLGWMLL